MGSQPREVEREGLAALRLILQEEFHFQLGHELRADAFVSSKNEGSSSSQSGGDQSKRQWLAMQLKIMSSRTRAASRKLKYVLKQNKETMHGIVLVGFSLNAADPVFCHLVHRCHNYDQINMSHPAWNCARNELCTHIRDLLALPTVPLYEDPARAFVYSAQTLVEVEARADFVSLLANSPVRYELDQGEFGAADAVVFLEDKAAHQFKVQEKVLSWRCENGTPLGLRASLRRSNGENYRDGDADFLLLHARTNQFSPHSSFRIYGSAFISWKQLEEHGYLRVDDGSPGRGSISLYPHDCPGVREGRDTWIEKLFHTRDELATEIGKAITAQIAAGPGGN